MPVYSSDSDSDSDFARLPEVTWSIRCVDPAAGGSPDLAEPPSRAERQTDMSATRWLAAVAGLVVLVGAGAYGLAATSDEPAERLFRSLATSEESGARVKVEQTVTDLLPRALFHFRSLAEDEPRPLGAGLAIGTVGEASEIAVEADWRLVAFTLTVDEGLGAFEPGSVLEVGLAVDSGMRSEEVVRGLGDLGQVVVGLDEPGFFSADRRLYSVRGDGSLLGVVAADGRISFPAMQDDDARAFVGDVDTVDELVEAARKPPVVITADDVAGTRVGDPVPWEGWRRAHEERGLTWP